MVLAKALSQQEAQVRDAQVAQLSECKALSEEEVVELATKCKELLQQETNVTHVHAPVVVVGDTHGQFHDLMEIFKITGKGEPARGRRCMCTQPRVHACMHACLGVRVPCAQRVTAHPCMRACLQRAHGASHARARQGVGHAWARHA